MSKRRMAKALRTRPAPPAELFDMTPYGGFMPAPDLWAWVCDNILTPGAPLHNPDHQHLVQATVGMLWADGGFKKQGRTVIGQAEQPNFMAGGWKRARQEMQFYQWFGTIPDFVITLDGMYCHACTDLEFVALVEHELYHCGQERDAFGAPKFSRSTGMPCFTIAGHDVEEFVGVVRRYGVGGSDSKLAELVHAAGQAPEVSKINVARACGTCVTRVA